MTTLEVDRSVGLSDRCGQFIDSGDRVIIGTTNGLLIALMPIRSTAAGAWWAYFLSLITLTNAGG